MYWLNLGARLLLGLVALAQGCGDDASSGDSGVGEDSGVDSGVDSGHDEDSGPVDPNGFAALYEDILAPTCAAVVCHGTGSGNLNMSNSTLAYRDLVNVPATGPECGDMGFTRVVPGDSAASLLVLKLDLEAPPCGETMPFGGLLLDSDVARIAAWIDAGALDN